MTYVTMQRKCALKSSFEIIIHSPYFTVFPLQCDQFVRPQSYKGDNTFFPRPLEKEM